MYSHLVRSLLGAFAALLCLCTSTGNAYADIKSTQTCSAAIIKAGAAFVQKETSILQKCRDAVLKGKVCDPIKLQKDLDAARTKLRDGIVKKCYGKDKSCDSVDADGSQPTLAEIGWEIPACPNFEGGTCTNPITDCDDIPTCIQCIGEASVNQAIDLYYPPNRPASTNNKTLNKCQAALGKAAASFLTAKSKALAKCWGAKVKKTATCPNDAQAAIDTARAKFDKALVKPCLGLTNTTIGLPANCTAVKPESLPACGGGVESLIQVGNCVSCVTEFKVECPDRVAARSVGAPYPPDCLVVPPTPAPTTTATATPTPSVTPTATLTAGPTATETPSGFCGDNIVQVGEFCDGTGTGGACGSDFACTNDCNCPCPSKVHFAADAFAPESILDTGWTGISHRAPIITNGDVTVALGCTATERPCGTCTVSGPIPNTKAGAGELDSRRCTNDTSIKCTTDSPCMSGGGTCQFYFGAPLPLAAGGVTTCVVNQFNGAVTGTANVETGEAVNIAKLTARVYNGLAIDNPCPRCGPQCVGGTNNGAPCTVASQCPSGACSPDATINDGVAGGICDGGPRLGLACDANGEVANRPDFGRTSLDCPTSSLGLIATLPIDLSNATDPVTRTVTALSPNCGDGSGEKCLCDTCNNAVASPCQSNADCVAVGATVCGGRRCLGGSNNGGPCNNVSACPGEGLCGKAGEPSAPSKCLDDTTTVNILDCNDTAPVDGEGECPKGPVTSTCSVASGHGQRSCGVDGDCTQPTGGSCPGCCVAGNRPCFLTGTVPGFPAGAGAKVGTQTLIAEGMEDPPMSDISSPTLGAVFCVGPTSSSSINAVAGLPGPGRVTIKGQAEGRP